MADQVDIKLVLDAKKAIDDGKKLAEQFAKLTDEEKKAAEALVAHNKELADNAKKTKDATKEAAELARTASEVGATFARGVGGGELAERLQHIKRGFAEIGDSGLTANQRVMAFAGTAGQLVRVLAAVGAQIVQTVDALAALSREAHGGATTELVRAWEHLKTAGTQLVYSVERLGESALHAYYAFYRWVPIIGQVLELFRHIPDYLEAATHALDTVTGALDHVTGSSHVAKDATGALGHEAGQLSLKLAQVDVYSRAVKDSTHQMGEKFDAAQVAARGLGDTLLAVKTNLHTLNLEIGEGETKLAAYSRILAQASERIVRERNQRGLLRDVARGLVAHGATREEANRALGLSSSGGGGARRDPYALYRQRAEEAAGADRNQAAFQAAVNEQFYGTVNAGAAADAAGVTAQRDRSVGALAGMNEGLAQLQANAQRALSAQTLRNSAGGQAAGQLGLVAAFENVRGQMQLTLRASQTFAEQFGETMGGAFREVTAAAQAHFGALLEGRETVGEAMRGMVHDTLMALAQDALGKALYNTAQGFALLASYQYPQAASAFTAAGLYAAFAAAAGVGAALTTAPSQAALPAGMGAGAGRERAQVAPSSSAGGGGGGHTIVINVNGAQFAPRQTQEAVVSALSDAARSGILQGSNFARVVGAMR